MCSYVQLTGKKLVACVFSIECVLNVFSIECVLWHLVAAISSWLVKHSGGRETLSVFGRRSIYVCSLIRMCSLTPVGDVFGRRFVYMYMHVHVCKLCMYIHIHTLCVYILCIHVYMYVHMYMYIYIYMHMYESRIIY